MPKNDVVYKGEDKQIIVPLTKVNGSGVVSPLDLDTEIDNLLAVIYCKKGNDEIVLEKYSINVLTGYNNADLEINTPSTGDLLIRVQAEKTRLAKVGEYFIEIKVRRTNTDFSNSNYDSIAKDVIVFQLKDSITGAVNNM